MTSSKLPQFVCVGGAKCGTTSLFEYLRGHPQIYLPPQKELHYFSATDLMQRPNGPRMRAVLDDIIKTEDAYRKQFAGMKEGQVGGDISPSYLNCPSAPDAIRALLGAPKILIMLRNPVDRMFSQYMHLRRAVREDLDFDHALAAEPQRESEMWGDMWLYRDSAHSADRVRKYFDVFGRGNVKVVLADDMRNDPRAEVRSILRFIDVDPEVSLDLSGEFNKSGLPKSRAIAKLTDASPLANLAKKIIPRRIGGIIKRKLQEMNTGERVVLSNEDRATYLSQFTEEIRQLEQLLGRSTGWLD